MKKLILSLMTCAGIVLTASAAVSQSPFVSDKQAKASCEHLTHGGYPTLPETWEFTSLCNIEYFVEFNNTCKVPYYAYEKLNGKFLNGNTPRSNDFRADPRVANSPTNGDYAKSGYDKGHMAPADDFDVDSAAMSQSFYLSNMIPQTPSHNRKTWKLLESAVRKTVSKVEGDFTVITGPAFTYPPIYIGNKVCVPDLVWKVILKNDSNEYVAFLTKNSGDIVLKNIDRVDISEIEKVTNLKLFPDIPREQLQNTLRIN